MRTQPLILSAAAAALLAGSALAAQPESGTSKPERDRTVLRGPDVKDAQRPGDRTAAPKEGERMGERRVELPFQAYIAALRSLQRGEDESLRLTQEQAGQIRTIAREHREAMRAFLQEHSEEIRRLREISGERGPMGLGGERRPGADDQNPRRPAGDRAPGRAPERARPGNEADDERGNRGRPAGDRPQRERGDRPDQDRPNQDRPNQDRPNQERRDTMEPMGEDERPNTQYTPEERADARAKLRTLLASAKPDKEMREQLMAVLTPAQRERVQAAIEAQRQRIRAGEDPDAEPQGDRPLRRGPGPAERPDDARPQDGKQEAPRRERLRERPSRDG